MAMDIRTEVNRILSEESEGSIRYCADHLRIASQLEEGSNEFFREVESLLGTEAAEDLAVTPKFCLELSNELYKHLQ